MHITVSIDLTGDAKEFLETKIVQVLAEAMAAQYKLHAAEIRQNAGIPEPKATKDQDDGS